MDTRAPLGSLVALALLLAMVGCAARALPPDRSTAALYRDLERLVTLRQATGWQIDRIEIEAILAEALMSTCQVEPGQRAALLHWLDGRIAALGGPVNKAYAERGKQLDRVGELLVLTRVRLALMQSMAVAAADCPFWLEPRAAFRGRQISDDRWQISLGGGGKAILASQGDQQDLQFGGASRALFGRNLGSSLGLYAGLEIGASASFPKDDSGARSALVLAVDVTTPVVLRYSLVNAYFEVEAGYLARVLEEDLSALEHGLHVGVSLGGRASRVRWFFPGAALGLSYERTFPGDADPLDPLADETAPLHMVKFGLRGAIDFDF